MDLHPSRRGRRRNLPTVRHSDHRDLRDEGRDGEGDEDHDEADGEGDDARDNVQDGPRSPTDPYQRPIP